MDNSDLQQIYRDSAWKHFAIHAEQRLKMFQFYITISTALLGGGVLLLRTGEVGVGIILVGFLGSFFSFVFWQLEARTRILVKNAEDAISYIDDSLNIPNVDCEPSPLELFARDEFRTRQYGRFALSHYSYHTSFVLVFAVNGGLGVIGVIYGVTHMFTVAR